MFTRFAFVFSVSAAVLTSPALASNWPQFRGPNGDGHADANQVPTTWSTNENVKWKTPIHGRAWSSPVVWGKQIWLTTATPDAKELFAVCVDADSGKIIRDQKLFDVERPQFHHAFNSPGSPTPVIEEGRVYITFGSPGTACLDTHSGKLAEWQQKLAPFKGAKITAYHNSWPYFARRFGLEIDLFLEPKPGIPPSPAHLAGVITKMKEQKVRAVLHDPFLDRKTADTVAKATGASVVDVTQFPGGAKGSEGGYVQMMDYLVNAVAKGLAGKTP